MKSEIAKTVTIISEKRLDLHDRLNAPYGFTRAQTLATLEWQDAFRSKYPDGRDGRYVILNHIGIGRGAALTLRHAI